MKTLALSPQQVAALAQVELCVAILQTAARATPGGLSGACVVAAKTLEKAHEEFVIESQRSVSIAAPGDMAAILHDGLKP